MLPLVFGMCLQVRQRLVCPRGPETWAVSHPILSHHYTVIQFDLLAKCQTLALKF
jgi:hypothetical protein